ncbi:MAG: hypothetical protein ACRDGA_06730 [Bacteroidota bacterium]
MFRYLMPVLMPMMTIQTAVLTSVLFIAGTEVSESQQSPGYRLAEILGALAPTEEYEHPAPLKYAVPVRGNRDTVLLVTMHGGKERPDRIVLWKDIGQFYTEFASFESLYEEFAIISSFEEPWVFTYQGERFLHIQETFSGTGYYHKDSIFVVHPNGEIQGVLFEPAPKGCEQLIQEKEAVWKGEQNDFTDDAMEFVFYIWNTETDANCCPTAGKVTGTYKLVKHQPPGASTATYTIMVDTFERMPVEE